MKILVIRLSSLGDIVLTEPVCALLHKAYPTAEIHYICKEQYTQLPEMFATQVKVIAYEKSLKFHLKVREEGYDIVLDLHGKLTSILLCLMLKANIKLRYNKQRGIRKAIVKGNHNLSIDSTVQLYAGILKKLGIDAAWGYPHVKELPLIALPGLDNAIAIFPGATHFTKRYPVAKWIEFINLNSQHQYVLLGGNTDIKACDSIASGVTAACTSFAGKHNFLELLQVMGQCRLVISGDTGPMHLAAALGKPQIAIFGGTHPRLGFRPLNDLAKVVCANIPCQPCSLHGEKACPLGHFNCMNQITPQMLTSAFHEVLSR